MRTIAVVTVGRSDYSIYLPLLRRIRSEPKLRLQLVAAGAHLSERYGMTVGAIESDGFVIGEQVHMEPATDTAVAIAEAMGVGTSGFARAFSRLRPDLLILLGDRYEMHAAAAAAVPLNIPMAHIHGGESTEGAIDEQFRHSITKLSHLHFASTELYGRRIVQMGEEPWRVTVSGAPGLDNLRSMDMLSRDALGERLGIDLSSPTLLATYHPVTLEGSQTEEQLSEFLGALEVWDGNIVFTYPNADPSNSIIVRMISRFAGERRCVSVETNLGTKIYFSLMAVVTAMVGNSSSGIIEAASFRLPVVNIGSRQRGRLRGRNVIDVACDRSGIVAAIEEAASPEFREALADMPNLYGDGHASERIVDRIRSVDLDERLLYKRFHDAPQPDNCTDSSPEPPALPRVSAED